MSVREQLRGHSLAIISLVVALTALGYTTWRNELTERNRNVRQAGFEMLVHIGELQRITYLRHFDHDESGGNPRAGWAEVLVLRDLAQLMPPPVPGAAEALFSTWNDGWQGLGVSDEAVADIDNAIAAQRRAVLAALAKLD